MALGEGIAIARRNATVIKWSAVALAFIVLGVLAKCDGDRRVRNATGLLRAHVADSVASVYLARERIVADSARRMIEAANALATAAIADEARMRDEVARIKATRPSIGVRGDTIFVGTPAGVVAAVLPADVGRAIVQRIAVDSVALEQALASATRLRVSLDSTRRALGTEQRAHELADSALVKRTEERDALRSVKVQRYGFRRFVGDATKVLAGIGVGVVLGAIFGN